MKTTLLFFLASSFLISCSKKTDSGCIKADISKLTTDFDAVVVSMRDISTFEDRFENTIKETVDTIDAKDGKFEYHFSIDGAKSFYFSLLKKNIKVGTIGFKNNFSKKEIFFGNVFLGNEDVTIYVDKLYDYQKAQGISCYKVDIKGSNEAEMFMKTFDRVLISKENIIDQPSCYALLDQLISLRENYSTIQLREFSSLFSEELKQSKGFKKFEEYIMNREKLEKSGFKPNFNWFDINGKNYNFEQVINGKENMLMVFWASWCRPCREEIPELKKFYEKYNDKVSIVSLSIDNEYEWWKKAVDKEKMPWLNLSGLPKNKNGVGTQYNISVVPTMILVDKHGKVLIEVVNDLPTIENLLKEKPIL